MSLVVKLVDLLIVSKTFDLLNFSWENIKVERRRQKKMDVMELEGKKDDNFPHSLATLSPDKLANSMAPDSFPGAGPDRLCESFPAGGGWLGSRQPIPLWGYCPLRNRGLQPPAPPWPVLLHLRHLVGDRGQAVGPGNESTGTVARARGCSLPFTLIWAGLPPVAVCRRWWPRPIPSPSSVLQINA